MALSFLFDVFREFGDDEAIVYADLGRSFRWLLEAIEARTADLARAKVEPGAIVSIETEVSAEAIASLLAVLAAGVVGVPLSPASDSQKEELLELAQTEIRLIAERGGPPSIQATNRRADHPLYRQLRDLGHPGLVLFTSGTTGRPKAAVHDMDRFLGKYRTRRHRLRTILFLLFDHVGGIDTLFQALANASTLIIPTGRTPDEVAQAIAAHRAEVLPASPSFLALLLLSEAHLRHDLSSLRYVTYGAEAMPQSTLNRLASAFPHVTLLQKYGLTELGTLRSHSRANDSLWLRIGGETFQTRVVEGVLQIKAESSMLGYLNAPSPITPDGWFVTGDAVEVRGDYLRILGRATDVINVGGRKVYPAEVEDAILEVSNVAEVAVWGEPHAFTGQVVAARASLLQPEDAKSVERRIRDHCRARLASYKVPVRVEVSTERLHTARQKIVRG